MVVVTESFEKVVVEGVGRRNKILELACDVALREGFSSVQWKRNFSALHLAAKLDSTECVRLLLQEANAFQGLVLRDDSGKLPIDYALALPLVDLELLDLLEPSQVIVAGGLSQEELDRLAVSAKETSEPCSPDSAEGSDADAFISRVRRSRHFLGDEAANALARALPTFMEKPPLESDMCSHAQKSKDMEMRSQAHNSKDMHMGSWAQKSKDVDMGSRAQGREGLPTLLGSHGLSR